MHEQLVPAPQRQLALHPAERDRAPQEARPEEPFLDGDEAFPEHLGPAGRDREGDVGRDRADVGDVVVQPLQLEEHRPQVAGASRHLDARQPFDGVRIGQGVPDRGVAGDRLGQEQAVAPRELLEALLDALVDVEEPELQVQHRFSGHPEAEVPRLDDAGMHGPDRHLEHPFAKHRAERVRVVARHPRDLLLVRESLPEGRESLGPVVVEGDAERIGVALGDEPEIVHDLALEPVRDRVLRGDRRKAGRISGDAGPDANEPGRFAGGPEVMEGAALRGPVVGGEERRQAQPRAGGLVGDRRKLLPLHLGGELAGPELGQLREAEPPPQDVAGGGHGPPSTTRTAAWTRSRSPRGR